jgi:hypothetical protein
MLRDDQPWGAPAQRGDGSADDPPPHGQDSGEAGAAARDEDGSVDAGAPAAGAGTWGARRQVGEIGAPKRLEPAEQGIELHPLGESDSVPGDPLPTNESGGARAPLSAVCAVGSPGSGPIELTEAPDGPDFSLHAPSLRKLLVDRSFYEPKLSSQARPRRPPLRPRSRRTPSRPRSPRGGSRAGPGRG